MGEVQGPVLGPRPRCHDVQFRKGVPRQVAWGIFRTLIRSLIHETSSALPVRFSRLCKSSSGPTVSLFAGLLWCPTCLNCPLPPVGQVPPLSGVHLFRPLVCGVPLLFSQVLPGPRTLEVPPPDPTLVTPVSSPPPSPVGSGVPGLPTSGLYFRLPPGLSETRPCVELV